VINNIPLTDAEIKDLPNKHAIDEFRRQVQRNPTRTELKYLGRWNPAQAIRQAEMNPDGEPDTLVAIKIPNVWNEVSVYAELLVSQVPGPQQGLVKGFRSLRYHDGDDAAWPMRTHDGELVRSDGGHLIVSPTFRAPHMSVEPCSESTWPKEITEKGMWHIETFIRPMWQYNDKRPPAHLLTEGPAQRVTPVKTDASELAKRVAELENELKKRR
jgi:hypothetical protein